MAKCSNCGCEYDKDEISLLHADVSKLSQDLCQDCLEYFMILAKDVAKNLMQWLKRMLIIRLSLVKL